MGTTKPAYQDLNLPQLRTYREVCRPGSYADAARHLFLTTSTVWEQIRGLERYPCTEAFRDRSIHQDRRHYLTHAGAAYAFIALAACDGAPDP